MIDEASALEELERRRIYGKPPARQPERCKHWDVCVYVSDRCNRGYALSKVCPVDAGIEDDCKHDTRTHTNPPAPAKHFPDGCTIEDCTCNKFADCPECLDQIRKARERVQKVLDFHKQYPRKSLYTNGFIIDELEESLRAQQQGGVSE